MANQIDLQAPKYSGQNEARYEVLERVNEKRERQMNIIRQEK
jgi:hypothetical protein